MFFLFTTLLFSITLYAGLQFYHNISLLYKHWMCGHNLREFRGIKSSNNVKKTERKNCFCNILCWDVLQPRLFDELTFTKKHNVLCWCAQECLFVAVVSDVCHQMVLLLLHNYRLLLKPLSFATNAKMIIVVISFMRAVSGRERLRSIQNTFWWKILKAMLVSKKACDSQESLRRAVILWRTSKCARKNCYSIQSS